MDHNAYLVEVCFAEISQFLILQLINSQMQLHNRLFADSLSAYFVSERYISLASIFPFPGTFYPPLYAKKAAQLQTCYSFIATPTC